MDLKMTNITLESTEKCQILILNGQFTGGPETDELNDKFEFITQTQRPSLIMDFSNTTYLSSIVIGLLVKMHARFAEKDGKLIISGLNSTLRSVLKMTKVDTVLHIVETLEEAKSKF